MLILAKKREYSKGHTDDKNKPVEVFSVAFSPDGNTIASATRGGIIRLWDVDTGEEKRILNTPAESATSVAFSPDGNTIATGCGEYTNAVLDRDYTIRLWDVDTGEEKRILKGHTGNVFSVAFRSGWKHTRKWK